MACSDLLKELAKDTFLCASVEVETSVRDALMRAVYDQSPDVSSLAMKCVPLLLRRARAENASACAKTLCAGLESVWKDCERRDASAMCLKIIAVDIGTFEREARDVTLQTYSAGFTASVERGAKAGATADDINIAAEAVDVLHALITTL